MNIVNILSSLNKIGLVAFLITLGFLIYEIWLLKKAGKSQPKPKVPQFKEGSQFVTPEELSISQEEQNKIKKNKSVLLILVVLLMLFGVITLVGYLNLSTSKNDFKPIGPNRTYSQTKAKKTGSTPTLTPIPSEEPTPTILPSPTPTEISLPTEISPTLDETSVSSPTPTIVDQLPVTGYINNMLILFSVAGLFIFFSFMF